MQKAAEPLILYDPSVMAMAVPLEIAEAILSRLLGGSSHSVTHWRGLVLSLVFGARIFPIP